MAVQKSKKSRSRRGRQVWRIWSAKISDRCHHHSLSFAIIVLLDLDF